MYTTTGQWAGKIQHTEFFFHQFIAYIFQTGEGRRMRGQFLRETLFRTLTYVLGAAPLLVILWFFHLLGDSVVGNAAIGLLIFDIAFGAAFLRTVYLYRHRVRAAYRIYFGAEVENPRDLPDDQVLDAVFDQLNERPEALSPSQVAAIDAARKRKDPQGDIDLQRIFECKRCKCIVTASLAQRNLPQQCPCGGQLVET